jgi:hypothetical protein
MYAMANSWGLLGNLARRGNDAFLAPFIVFPNIGFSAINAMVGTTARVAEATVRAAGSTGLVPFAALAEDFSRRVADRTLTIARETAALAVAGAGQAIGQDSGRTANALLASTLLEKGTETAVLPLLMAVDGVAAALTVEPSRQAAIASGMLVSRGLDTVSAPGVIPGNVGADTAALSRFGFYHMTTNGPIEAVARDVRGVIGGLLALALGDLDWSAQGLRSFQISAEYVYEKVEHGEVGPRTDIPISVTLGEYGTTIIQRFPEEFVQALASGDPLQVIRAYFKEADKVTTLYTLYPIFTFLVLYDVAVFFGKGLLDGPDGQKYALCELAIMESQMDNAAKDTALAELRHTAPNTIIEYEYYVPLLVPFDGTVEDKVYRRNAAGEIIDTHTVIPSVFKSIAMHIAQSLCSEVISLRSFLWLYGDEQVAREKNYRETARKYGPEVAQRLAEQPRYPLTREQIAELTQAGPRAPAAVAAILEGLLRERGLGDVADRIKARGGWLM